MVVKKWKKVCVDCGNVVVMDWSKEHKCLECSGNVERLSGFFERHPDFKDKN